MASEQENDDDLISKSQLKREADSARALGEDLAALSPRQRARIPIDDDLRQVIDEYNRIHQRGARKRQLGFLAKQLRRIDLEPVEAAMAELQREARASVEDHHLVENWRDRLLGMDANSDPQAALTKFLQEHPATERQQLRQLLRDAQREQAADKPPRHTRELFRLLRSIIAAARQDPDD